MTTNKPENNSTFNAEDNQAAREYVEAVRTSRLRSTGELLNATGMLVAICAFEAGARYAREKMEQSAGRDDE